MKPVNYQSRTSFGEVYFPTFTRILRGANAAQRVSPGTSSPWRALWLAALCVLIGPKAVRANEILGHAGWSVSADSTTLVWSNPGTKVSRENQRDARQLHTVRSGNRGGVMYVNKATNGCLLAHGGHNGAPAGYWQECQANDPKMNWYREHVGGGDYRLRNVAYPEFCLDAPAN